MKYNCGGNSGDRGAARSAEQWPSPIGVVDGVELTPFRQGGGGGAEVGGGGGGGHLTNFDSPGFDLSPPPATAAAAASGGGLGSSQWTPGSCYRPDPQQVACASL